MPVGPTSHVYFSQRLRLHYVDWGNDKAPPLILVHGGQDHCRSWDWVAQIFHADYHVIAPDLRGHGDSQWMVGSHYSLIDYVYDLAQLIQQTQLAPVSIIGHSLGGRVSLQYAGIYPDDVHKIVAIEGLGPTPDGIQKDAMRPAQDRMHRWITRVRKLSGRLPRRYASIDDALARMRAANPHLSVAQARHLTVHGTNQNEDGTYSWKFDNYSRAGSPFLFHAEEAYSLWAEITAPTLLVSGAESSAGDPANDGRLQHFHNGRSLSIENANHWVHHDQLDRFMAVVQEFLAEKDGRLTPRTGD